MKIIIGTLLIVAAALALLYFRPFLSPEYSLETDIDSLPPTTISESVFGFNPDSMYMEDFVLEENQVLGDILNQYGINHAKVMELAIKAEDIFSVRSLRAGKNCYLVRDNYTGDVRSFIYEPSAYRYVQYDILPKVNIEVFENEVETCIEESSGTISGSLWLSMQQEGHKYELIAEMEDALAWSIDFHHVLEGDQYKLIFEREYINGEAVGIGKLSGAYFKNYNNEYYSIFFENEKYAGFYDEEGRPMKKAFLKAPVKYSRISSGFSRRRFHPVLKRYKGHFGTDYAAGCGTPIMAVADGVVNKVGYTGGNGNFVKIRHDDMYQTQYLHMSKFAKDIRSGVHVKQGQVIGYVGKTGLATGCHVCFRFWKNGKQVNHLREKLPPPDPMPEHALPLFFEVRDVIKKQIDDIQIQEISMEEAEDDTSD